MIKVINDELLVVQFYQLVDLAVMMKITQELNESERARFCRKRLVFLENIKKVDFTIDDITAYKNCMCEPAELVQTAFVAFNEYQYGMARMFQSILGSDNNRTEVFNDMESAAQ